jgi:hypothetical protein
VNDVFINTSNGDLFTKTPTGWNLSSNVAVEREVTVTEIQTVTETRFVQIPGGSLGEGSTSFETCDDEVAISATPIFDATSSTWRLNTIAFSGISPDCAGQTLAIQLFDSVPTERYASILTINSTSVSFTGIDLPADEIDELAFSIYE